MKVPSLFQDEETFLSPEMEIEPEKSVQTDFITITHLLLVFPYILVTFPQLLFFSQPNV